MDAETQARALEALAHRFAVAGLVVRDAPFFGELGIGVSTPAVEHEGLRIIDAMLFVYPTRDGWQLRVTEHGGRHWVRDASLDELEAAARGWLSAPARPPGPGWREV